MTTTSDQRASRPESAFESSRWRWFAAWAAVGVLLPMTLLGAFTIGVFMLPLAVLGSLALARRPAARRAVVGLVTGFGLPLLWVAYLNRSGPGFVCTSTATSQSCDQQWAPWPWLAVGLVAVAAGVLAFARAQARHRRALVTPPQTSGSGHAGS